MRRRAAFTLVELLVVITIIGILMGLAIPASQSVLQYARKTACAANIGNLVKAMLNYESQYQRFPPGRVGCDCSTTGQCANVKGYQRAGTSGFVLLLPFLDEGVLFESFGNFRKGAVYPPDSCGDDTTKGWDASSRMRQALTFRPTFMVCRVNRADPTFTDRGGRSAPVGSYAMCMGSLGPRQVKPASGHSAAPKTGYHSARSSGFSPGSLSNSDAYTKVAFNNTGMFMYRVPRGTNEGSYNTILLGEVQGGSTEGTENRWMIGIALADCLRSTETPMNYPDPETARKMPPTTGPQYWGGFGSYHVNGANFAFAGGHVKFLLDSIDQTLYEYMSMRSPPEAFTPPD